MRATATDVAMLSTTKMAEPIEMPFGGVDSGKRKEPYIRREGAMHYPTARGNACPLPVH